MTTMFASANHEVIGLDCNLFADCACVPPETFPTISKDIRAVETADLEGIDAIVHLAGICNDPLGNLNPRLTTAINYESSIRLATLAKRSGVRRFVFSSSCSIYGAAGSEFATEESPQNPVTVYGKSKIDCEAGLARLADSKFCPTYLRNATAFGFSSRLRLDLVLNEFVASAYTTGRILVKSDGTPWRPLVHVRDISSAFLAVLDAPEDRVWNQAFNVGANEENYRVSDLAEIVSQTVPGTDIEYAKDGGPDKRCYRVDCSKIRSRLPAFEPQWSVRRGTAELYNAYRHIGLGAADMSGSRYYRVRRVVDLIETGFLDAELRWKAMACSVGER
jgi:nucleoside-diphosphate-sugar epimerase